MYNKNIAGQKIVLNKKLKRQTSVNMLKSGLSNSTITQQKQIYNYTDF
jgi:hypothetical protein